MVDRLCDGRTGSKVWQWWKRMATGSGMWNSSPFTTDKRYGEVKCSDMTDERHIIISVDLAANPGNIRIDLGNLAPHLAYAVLHQALDALEQMGAEMTVIHDGRRIVFDDDQEQSA